jgi:aryl-phospho-beta-D-glucosidase BglC (GH1 family)
MKTRLYWLRNLFLITISFISPIAIAITNCDKPFELSTQQNQIVDSCGNKIKLKSVNWYGAHESSEVVGGLDHQSLEYIVTLIKNGGFNSVRLSFSNQMLHNTLAVDPARVAANPALVSKTPLEVFDDVVNALTDAGLIVILNNHTTTSTWCCGFDYNGLWYHPRNQTTEQWIDDWTMLAKRYRDNPLVAGYDLRNEVRTTKYQNTIFPENPNWGLGDKNDWKLAATSAGNAIHKVNPKVLIIVEGINWSGIPMLGGYRPMLTEVKDNPIVLAVPHKLVYQEHVYAFTGPSHTGDPLSSIGHSRYSDMDEATLRATLDKEFGYISELRHAYTAPVWLGEFGVSGENASELDKDWFRFVTNYLIDKDMGWALWALNPERADGTDDFFGLMNKDWSGYREDWRREFVQRLLEG